MDRFSIGTVISKFPQEVLERFDFTNAKYHGALKRMTGIVCPKHGEFSQYPAQLRKNGATCQGCGAEVWNTKKRKPARPFLDRVLEIHGDQYDYSKTVYVRTHDKVVVTCREHGDFRILPLNHLNGQGCPACGALKRGHRKDPIAAGRKTAESKIAAFKEDFIRQAREVHGDKYDYSEVDYIGRKEKVWIICPEHGKFEQEAQHHLYRGHGCAICSHHASKGERAILDFMQIFSQPLSRDRTVMPPKELDIYLPEAKLAIEYCGEYWHGADCAKDEPFARKRHFEKFKACRDKDIRLLTIYESEWLNRSGAILRLIRNAMGKGRGRVMARKCEVRHVSNGQATQFYEAHHPQGGSGYGINYGLFYRDKLVACMRFAFGANDRGAYAERVWTLSRYATKVSVAGGASRLFAAFVDEHDPDVVKSFSDNRYFTGDMYERLGFHMQEESEPDYQVYHQKLGLMPKSAWQRKKIPARIRELGSSERFDPNTDHRSERDMTFLLGALRIYDCGKKRWVWTPINDLI